MELLINHIKKLGFKYNVSDMYLSAYKLDKYLNIFLMIPTDEIEYYIKELKLK